MDMLVNALKNGSGSLKEKMCLLMNTYLIQQQMGEAEAVYKKLPDVYFKESNTTTIFVPNCPRRERSKFLLHVDEQSPFLESAVVKVRVRQQRWIKSLYWEARYSKQIWAKRKKKWFGKHLSSSIC